MTSARCAAVISGNKREGGPIMLRHLASHGVAGCELESLGLVQNWAWTVTLVLEEEAEPKKYFER